MKFFNFEKINKLDLQQITRHGMHEMPILFSKQSFDDVVRSGFLKSIIHFTTGHIIVSYETFNKIKYIDTTINYQLRYQPTDKTL